MLINRFTLPVREVMKFIETANVFFEIVDVWLVGLLLVLLSHFFSDIDSCR